MCWKVGDNGIDIAAMDGSQRKHLVNADTNIFGLTIDTQGKLYFVVFT